MRAKRRCRFRAACATAKDEMADWHSQLRPFRDQYGARMDSEDPRVNANGWDFLSANVLQQSPRCKSEPRSALFNSE